MKRFTVSIGQYVYISAEDGLAWNRSLREVPGRHTPVIRGEVDLSCLPPRLDGGCWDFATILPCGFGVAVGFEVLEHATRKADVFITQNGGGQWRSIRDRGARTVLSRSVERFESLALSSPNRIALSWDDPWSSFDGSQAHVVCSYDQGESWQYHCLGYTNPYISLDHGGRLLALNDSFFLESLDGGMTWGRRDFVVAWPQGYGHRRVALLRHMTFTEPGLGYRRHCIRVGFQRRAGVSYGVQGGPALAEAGHLQEDLADLRSGQRRHANTHSRRRGGRTLSTGAFADAVSGAEGVSTGANGTGRVQRRAARANEDDESKGEDALGPRLVREVYPRWEEVRVALSSSAAWQDKMKGTEHRRTQVLPRLDAEKGDRPHSGSILAEEPRPRWLLLIGTLILASANRIIGT
jgi:hypothetical protein